MEKLKLKCDHADGEVLIDPDNPHSYYLLVKLFRTACDGCHKRKISPGDIVLTTYRERVVQSCTEEGASSGL